MGPSFPILAAFITPGLVTAGAAAMAAPILIHLLARRRFKRIRWAAMDFLIDAERRNRRRIRMEEWILLALRCLAVFLIGMVVARPFINPASFASALGGSRHSERVLVLDDSFSTSYESADGITFARAKLAARKLLEMIREESPDDSVTILRMSAVDKPVVSGAFLDSAHFEQLLARLEGLSPSQRSIDIPSVFEGIVDVLQREEGMLSAVVYVISDFQRVDWIATRDREGPGATTEDTGSTAADPLLGWAGDDRGLRVLFVNVGDENASNSALIGLTLKGGRMVAGTAGTLRAEVANYSSRSLDQLELHLSVGDRLQESEEIPALDERQTVSVELEAQFLRTGDAGVRIDLPPDALPLDNARFLAADVVGAVRILIVNGEPSDDAYGDEVALLATALRPEGEVFSGHEIVVVDEAGLEDVHFAAFDVVILANIYRLSEPTVASLERFVLQGGGVMILPGDQVDADLYNATFYRSGEGLSPAQLLEVLRPAEPATLVVTDRLHPAMRGVGREDDPLGIGRIPFFEFFACRPFGPSGEQIDPSGGEVENTGDQEVGPDAAASPAHVIARFDDPGGHPAIIERRFGLGRVLLITSTADKEWNLWPDHPTYLPVMMELVRGIARRGERGAGQWVGTTIELPFDPAVFESEAIMRTPAFPNEPEVVVTATPTGDGDGLTLRWEHTENAGFYQFVLRRHDGREFIRLTAVNVDPRESDLAMAREDELRRAMGALDFTYISGLDELREGASEARTELWRPLLIALVVVLMAEQSLAWLWGRRR